MTPENLANTLAPGLPDWARHSHQMLKAQAYPLPEVRQFRPEHQRHPVTNTNTLGTSWGSYQPIFNLSSEPGGAAKEEQGDLPVPWCCLVALSSNINSQPFHLFPSNSPPGGACTGLRLLPAGFHSPSHSECYTLASLSGLRIW